MSFKEDLPQVSAIMQSPLAMQPPNKEHEKNFNDGIKQMKREKFDEAVEGLTPEEINAARQKAAQMLAERKKIDTMKAEKLRVLKRNRELRIKSKNKAKRKTQKQSRKRNR